MDWWQIVASGIKSQVNNVNDSGSLEDTVKLGINAGMYIAGIAAVIVIILGGITYATSQGDPSKIQKAKKTIIGGLIGLIIVVLAFAIVTFVLGSLQ